MKHGHFTVNGKQGADAVDAREAGLHDRRCATARSEIARISGALETAEGRAVPHWLEVEKEAMKGLVKAMPQREDITMPIDEQLIVELYSR